MHITLDPATQEILAKFLRFCVVGVIGTIIDFGITYLSKEVFKTSQYVANAFGFIIAASTNYFLNKNFAFHNHDTNYGWQYTQFILISAVGLGINTGIIYICQKRFRLNFYVGKVAATGVVMFWNFIMNMLITFAR